MVASRKPVTKQEQAEGTIKGFKLLAGYILFDWCRTMYKLKEREAKLIAELEAKPTPRNRARLSYHQKVIHSEEYFAQTELCHLYEDMTNHTLNEFMKLTKEKYENGKKTE